MAGGLWGHCTTHCQCSNYVFLSCSKSYNVGDCAIKIPLCEQRAGIRGGAGEGNVSMSVQGLGWGGGEGCIKFWI